MNGRDRFAGRPPSAVARLRLPTRNVRQRMRAAAVDALVVSHLPNIRYLTGFVGTAGLVVLTPDGVRPDRGFPLSDRGARASVSQRRSLAEHVTSSCRRRVTTRRSPTSCASAARRRIGIEAALDAGQPVQPAVGRARRRRRRRRCGARTAARRWSPTERIIEAERVVKDEVEIGDVAGGRATARLAATAEAASLARAGPVGARGRCRHRRALAPARVSSARRSRRLSPPGRTAPCRTRGPGDRSAPGGDGVVLDFGGVYDGYCVDLTRTVQLGDAGADFRRLFAAVAEAQRPAIAAVRPGVKASAVDDAARSALGRYGLEEAFGHGTGHGLGLEVHEEPRIGRPLAGQPDLVLAAGHGVYDRAGRLRRRHRRRAHRR